MRTCIWMKVNWGLMACVIISTGQYHCNAFVHQNWSLQPPESMHSYSYSLGVIIMLLKEKKTSATSPETLAIISSQILFQPVDNLQTF